MIIFNNFESKISDICLKRMSKRNLYKILVLAGITLSLTSCLKDAKELGDKISKINGVKWDPDIALPLVNTTLTLDDVIKSTKSTYIKTESDGGIMIAYRGELFSQSAEEFVEIDNQSFSKELTLSPSQQTYLSNNGSISLQFVDFMNYNTGNIEIDSVLLKVCNSQLRVQSTFQHDLEIKFTLPHVKRNGIPFTKTLQSDYTGTLIDVSDNVNLSGYMFDMSKGGLGHNQVQVDMELKITKRGSNPIQSTDKVTASMFMLYNKFKIMYGYIGQESFMSDVDTLKFDALDKLSGGSFTLEDPRFKLFIYNSMGVPIQADVSALKSYNEKTGSTNLTGVPNPIPIPVPNYNEVGKVLVDSIVLNKNTSNIATIINSRPSGFIYGFNVTANPAGSSVRNFVMDTSRITFEVDVEVPLHGTASDITLDEIQDADFNLGEEVDFLEEVLVRLAINNGFPLGVDVQVYLLDSSGKTLDSVFTNSTQFLPAAPVNVATGRVTNSVKNVVDIVFKEERIKKLNETTQVRIKGILNTSRSGGIPVPVKLYTDYGIGVKLGVQAKIKFNQKF